MSVGSVKNGDKHVRVEVNEVSRMNFCGLAAGTHFVFETFCVLSFVGIAKKMPSEARRFHLTEIPLFLLFLLLTFAIHLYKNQQSLDGIPIRNILTAQ